MSNATILVVDDEPDIRSLVKDILEDEGYQVVLAEHAEAAREARRLRRPDLVLLDIWMPDTDGISLLREWTERGGLPCPVVMMSGHGTIETAVEATRLGAYDFIEKPISLAKLLLTLKRALETGRLQQENENLRKQIPNLPDPVGASPSMQALSQQIDRVAASTAPVLISGEPGTGKEALARHIHGRSPRQTAPFERVALAVLPNDQARAALFGSEENQQVSYGAMDRAQGGTLFLDELSLLDLECQRELASAMEAGSYARVGSAVRLPIDARIICASSRDLAVAIENKTLDRDLYFQLNVLPLEVPPLRKRIDDVPELLQFYADYFAQRDGISFRKFSVSAQNRLRQHDWPGNLRELRNMVQRLLILGGNGDINASEVDKTLGAGLAPLRPASSNSSRYNIDFSMPLREARDAFEREYLGELLKQADGSVSQLATMTGMERTHLYRKLRDLSVEIRSGKN